MHLAVDAEMPRRVAVYRQACGILNLCQFHGALRGSCQNWCLPGHRWVAWTNPALPP
jgi:hypothetical protein